VLTLIKASQYATQMLSILGLVTESHSGICITNAGREFLVGQRKDAVGKFDAATGATINANFITGLNAPFGITVSGNDLFVSNKTSSSVGELDPLIVSALAKVCIRCDRALPTCA
jgi:hypothetical protein